MSPDARTETVRSGSPQSISRRSLLVAAGGGALGLGLAACTGSSPSSPSEAPSGSASASSGGASGAVTITLWDTALEQVDFHKQAAEEFHKDHPNITLEWRDFNQDQLEESLPLAFKQQPPDIFVYLGLGNASMNYLLGQGWIRPFTPENTPPKDFLSRWKNPDDLFVDGVLRDGDDYYTFPTVDTRSYDGGYMFYRTDVLQRAGLDPANLPATWTEFRAWCETIKSKTGVYPISSPLKGSSNPDRFIRGIIMAGAETDDIFNLKTGRFNIADGPITDSIKYVQDLYAAGLIVPGFYDKDVARGYFAAGKAAICCDGFWLPSVWRAGGFTDDSKYTVAGYITPDPGMEQGRAQLALTGSNMFVSAKTKNPEAVWEFIQWYTQPDGWFAKNFVGQNFATLSFADNARFVTGDVEKRMLEIANTEGFRVIPPLPMLKCKDAARSQAYSKATSQKSSWEMDEAAQAVLQNSDFGPVASKIAETRQKWFEDALNDEKKHGLDVSVDCFTFPEWVRTQDYDRSNYPKK